MTLIAEALENSDCQLRSVVSRYRTLVSRRRAASDLKSGLRLFWALLQGLV